MYHDTPRIRNQPQIQPLAQPRTPHQLSTHQSRSHKHTRRTVETVDTRPHQSHSSPSPLTPDEVRRITRLARIELPEARLAPLGQDLATIVAYVNRLRALNLEGVEPLTHVADETNRLAADEPGPTLSTQTLIDMAPESDGLFVKVPKVLDDQGGGA